MTRQVELPFVLKAGMDLDTALMAIQRNFDHVTGTLGVINETLPSEDVLPIEDIEQIAFDAADDVITKLTEAGLSPIGDGEVPSTVTPTVIGGIGDTLFVTWDTTANPSAVSYEVHISLTNGFTPDATSLVATYELAGQTGFLAQWTITEMPNGAVLVPGTTYYVKVVPKDIDGVTPGPYPQASGTPRKAGTVHIEGGSITATLLASNSVVTDKLAAGAVTATKMNVTTLSAITANLGTVIAGNMTAVSYSTAGTNAIRIVMTALGDDIQFITADNIRRGILSFDAGLFDIGGEVGTSLLLKGGGNPPFYDISLVPHAGGAGVYIGGPVTVDGTLQVFGNGRLDLVVRTTDPPAPPAGALRFYAYNGATNQLRSINSNGNIRIYDSTLV